ncbi:MAG: histidine triad nucleotide-binding protein [Gorillibacterium sp.]|nr:histidine triad nucleotide-binding protein [Gorillibacterium sp.]
MDCIFCKIVNGDIPSNKIFEDEYVIAFHDIQPAAPVHALIIPKKHIASLKEIDDGDWDLIGHIHRVARQIAEPLGVSETGYRLVNNCGPDAGQVVFHLHYHLLGGKKLGSTN